MALQRGAYHSAGRQPRLRAMLRTAVEVAEGMAYIHSRRIVHGDLSSRNVLLMRAHAEADATAKVTAGSPYTLQTLDSQMESSPMCTWIIAEHCYGLEVVLLETRAALDHRDASSWVGRACMAKGCAGR